MSLLAGRFGSRRTLALVLLAALVFAACGDDAAETTTTAPPITATTPTTTTATAISGEVLVFAAASRPHNGSLAMRSAILSLAIVCLLGGPGRDDGRDVAAGACVYEARADAQRPTGKLALVRWAPRREHRRASRRRRREAPTPARDERITSRDPSSDRCRSPAHPARRA